MKILYLHGLHSKPGGVKPLYLAYLGHEIINPGLPDDDFPASVRIAQEAFDAETPEVVVGSSRGGAVAMNLNTGDVRVVLIAPAWKKWGTVQRVPSGTIILHSRGDQVIPLADSEFLVADGLARLDVVGRDHNMTDGEAFGALQAVLEEIAGRKP